MHGKWESNEEMCDYLGISMSGETSIGHTLLQLMTVVAKLQDRIETLEKDENE